MYEHEAMSDTRPLRHTTMRTGETERERDARGTEREKEITDKGERNKSKVERKSKETESLKDGATKGWRERAE